jgi:plastocyanin
MKAKIASNALRNGVLIAMALLVTIVGIIISTAALASAQGSNTVQISIVSDASRLTNTAYQPNPINIKVGDTVEWINDDSAPHTVTEKSRSTNNNEDSDDNSNSGIVEKIVDEIITNIVINIRNNMGGGKDENNSLKGNPLSSSAEFDSGIMQTGQIFSYTFSNPGTFESYCTVHPSMVAEIVVS